MRKVYEIQKVRKCEHSIKINILLTGFTSGIAQILVLIKNFINWNKRVLIERLIILNQYDQTWLSKIGIIDLKFHTQLKYYSFESFKAS